jgi:hypothetical protein
MCHTPFPALESLAVTQPIALRATSSHISLRGTVWVWVTVCVWARAGARFSTGTPFPHLQVLDFVSSSEFLREVQAELVAGEFAEKVGPGCVCDVQSARSGRVDVAAGVDSGYASPALACLRSV